MPEPPTRPAGDEAIDRLALGAGGLLVGLAAAHVAYFMPASIRALDEWRAGALWTLERDVEMTGVDAAFWSLPGGFALPLGLLGLLVRRHARRGTPPPAWLGYGVGAWALIGSLISEPSGFPIGLVPAGMLVAASRRARRAGGPRDREHASPLTQRVPERPREPNGTSTKEQLR